MEISTMRSLIYITLMLPIVGAIALRILKSKDKILQNSIAMLTVIITFLCCVLLIKPIITEGNVITAWIGTADSIIGTTIGIGVEVDELGIFFGIISSLISSVGAIYVLKFIKPVDELNKYYILVLLLMVTMLSFIFSADLITMFCTLEILIFITFFKVLFVNGKSGKVLAELKPILKLDITSSLLIIISLIAIGLNYKTINIAEIAAINMGKEQLMVKEVIIFFFIIMGYLLKLFNAVINLYRGVKGEKKGEIFNAIQVLMISIIGTYSLIRIVFNIFALGSNKAVGNLLIITGLLTILVTVTITIMQIDLKKIIILSILSQAGYVITSLGIGIVEVGNNSLLAFVGTIYQSFNNNIVMILLILASGYIVAEVRSVNIKEISGLSKRMPFTTIIFIFLGMAIVGIPPFSGFISKLMIYQAGINGENGIITIVSLIASIMTLIALIRIINSIFFGPAKVGNDDSTASMDLVKVFMGVVAFVLIIIGLMSKSIVNKFILPIVNGIVDSREYVGAAIGDKGSTLSLLVRFTEDNYRNFNVYNEGPLLIVFTILFFTIVGVIVFKGNSLGEEIKEGQDTVFDISIFKKYQDELKFNQKKSQARFVEGCKYDVFVGGEEGDKVKLEYEDIMGVVPLNLQFFLKEIKITKLIGVSIYKIVIIVALMLVGLYLVIFI